MLFYLLETPVGLALFKKSDTTTLVSKLAYSTLSGALESVRAMSSPSHPLPAPVASFLASFLSSTAAPVNTLSPQLAALLARDYGVRAVCQPDDCFRSLKKNAFKWFGINKELYNGMTAAISHRLLDSPPADSMLISALSGIEDLDRGINSRIMRLKEWYSIHFPELADEYDGTEYLGHLLAVGDRATVGGAVGAPDGAALPPRVASLAGSSMGVDIGAGDMDRIREDARDILRDIEHRGRQAEYLRSKCSGTCPSLTALVGDLVAARLLRKTGGLSQLAVLPSSTIQILGAEKAFSEAVRMKKNTPKYGLIYDSQIVASAPADLRGRVARMLANKIALCARVDLAAEGAAFGSRCRQSIRETVERLADQSKKEPRLARQQPRGRHISVKEYDENRDTNKANKKTNKKIKRD